MKNKYGIEIKDKYRVIGESSREQFQTELNEYSQMGWDIIHFSVCELGSGNYFAILEKRNVKTSTDPE